MEEKPRRRASDIVMGTFADLHRTSHPARPPPLRAMDRRRTGVVQLEEVEMKGRKRGLRVLLVSAVAASLTLTGATMATGAESGGSGSG